MANFEPRWDLVAGTNIIKEGQETYFKVVLSKQVPTEISNSYDIDVNQYLELVLNISSQGDTFEERDVIVTVGETTQTLKPFSLEHSGNPNLLGKHTIKLDRKSFQLSGGKFDAFYIRIQRPFNGVWNSTETLQFEVQQIHLFTIEDDQVAEEIDSGTLGTTTKVLTYDASGEVWVTPDLKVHDGELFAIGGIGYGAEPRLFVQAYGQSRMINGVRNVFMPTYEVLDITMSDIPSENKTGSGTILVPDESSNPPIPDYPIALGTARNQINSFYIKGVADLMDGAGCIIQGATLTDHNNDLYYSYGIRVYANTGFKLMCPAEAESIYLSNVSAVTSGGINSSLSELTEYGISASNKIGRCDIYGNVKHEPQTIVLPPATGGGQMVIYIRVKVGSEKCPPWISFTVTSFTSPVLKSTNTLDNRIYINTNSTALNSVELDNILHAAVAGSGWTTTYNANNAKVQVPNSIQPVTIRKLEENGILIRDEVGSMVKTGLKFNANGQFVQTFAYDSEPVDAYFKARVLSVKDFYSSEADAYYVGKRFRAYSVWICPTDVSNFDSKPKPNHLYQLKDTKVYPYVVDTVLVDGVNKLLFEEDKWNDLGVYNESLGNNIIGKERMFRIVVNDNTDSDIGFITDSNLGQIHVGEYFGHTVYPKIEATGSALITYEIDHKSSRDDIIKYGLDLSADGFMIGTAYATSGDFSSNDDVKLEFDIVATGREGKSVKSTFKLSIVRGFGENYMTAMANPSLTFERAWFKMIASNAYGTTNFYRASDPRYGLQKVPRILLKENCLDPLKPYTGFTATKKLLQEKIIDPVNGAPEPTGAFKVTLGNYKVRSAIDDLGNVLYDVLYREIHPQGTQVALSTKPYEYTLLNDTIIGELYGLRQNIFLAVGEDTQNLLTDPTDLRNRGIVVDAINGLSAQMLDTVPRYMNHPYIQNATTVKAQYMTVIPVAYLPPNKGEAFFNTLLQNNEHGTMLNQEFDISSVEFLYFTQDAGRHIQTNFVTPLKMSALSN